MMVLCTVACLIACVYNRHFFHTNNPQFYSVFVFFIERHTAVERFLASSFPKGVSIDTFFEGFSMIFFS